MLLYSDWHGSPCEAWDASRWHKMETITITTSQVGLVIKQCNDMEEATLTGDNFDKPQKIKVK
jgi:hypothetical protein